MEDKRFNKIIQKTLRWEGGYVNNPQDRGGETNYGLSQRAHPDLDIKNITQAEAILVYQTGYWARPAIYKINNDALAGAVFDFGVTAGPHRGIKFLQQAANPFGAALFDDGIIGPKTLNFVNNYKHQTALLMAFKAVAADYYMGLATKYTTQQQFLAGWLNRLAE